jgi:hypothetical protein
VGEQRRHAREEVGYVSEVAGEQREVSAVLEEVAAGIEDGGSETACSTVT